MKTLLKDTFTSPKIYWGITITSVLIGIIIRFWGLGKWPLALDEYYIIKSTENILKYGLPQFESGGYYVRGILLQYMIAPLLSLGIKAELAGRIFPMISNLLAIPALYLISKKIGGQLVATIVIVIFSFSIWEIEFARFARMYAPFQTIFIWYVYFFVDDVANRKFSNYKWMLALSFISIFVYEGSVFLAVFNFIPFILNRRIKLNYLFWSIIIFVGSVLINKLGFRYLNSNPIFPPEYSEFIYSLNSNPPIKIPKILLPFAFENTITIVFTIFIIAISCFLIFKIIKSLDKKNFWSIFSVLLLGIFAILNQFGLFLLSFLIVYFWNLIDSRFLDKKKISFFILLFAVNLVYWFIVGLLSNNWFELFNDFSSYTVWGISKRLVIGFFNYPDNYYSLLNYFKTLPLLTSFSVVSLIILFYFLIKDKENKNINLLVGTIIFLSLIATIPTLLYKETRYTFFLVPIVITLTVYSVYFIMNKIFAKQLYVNIAFTLIILFVFISSKDFDAYHLLNIDKQDVNYRMIYKSNFIKKHLYRRWDVLTPTEFVKNDLQKDDLIIINENSLEYYLPRVDYFNINYKHEAFIAISVDNGTKERWSNAKLIYTNDDLINFIENRNSTIWFIVFPENWLKDINFYERYKPYLVCEGIDKLVKVYKFPKRIEQ